jgi:hypothetical protein
MCDSVVTDSMDIWSLLGAMACFAETFYHAGMPLALSVVLIMAHMISVRSKAKAGQPHAMQVASRHADMPLNTGGNVQYADII